MEILKVNNLVRNYKKGDGEDVNVLKGLNFDIVEKEYVGVMGRSGCGKTTLLKVLGMIDEATEGDISFKGKDIRKLSENDLADIRRQQIGFVFQDFYLMDSLSVRENIALPLILDKTEQKETKARVEEYARQFGIEYILDKNPHQLSGGEKQRAAICRALINNPDLILADEPTGNLDSKSGQIVAKALQSINEKLGKTITMVTHDPKMASYCKRIIFLKDGMILEDLRRTGSSEEFYQEILKRMKEL